MAAEELLDYAEGDIFRIAQKRQRNDYAKIQDVLMKNLRIIDQAVQNKGQVIVCRQDSSSWMKRLQAFSPQT